MVVEFTREQTLKFLRRYPTDMKDGTRGCRHVSLEKFKGIGWVFGMGSIVVITCGNDDCSPDDIHEKFTPGVDFV